MHTTLATALRSLTYKTYNEIIIDRIEAQLKGGTQFKCNPKIFIATYDNIDLKNKRHEYILYKNERRQSHLLEIQCKPIQMATMRKMWFIK